jgi:hypothetical protein
MNEKHNRFAAVWHLYRDGFRNMTWGKPLWGLIILKAIILFAVLRVFFFKPAMAGMSDRQKSEQVGRHLTNPSNANNGQTINIHNLKL